MGCSTREGQLSGQHIHTYVHICVCVCVFCVQCNPIFTLAKSTFHQKATSRNRIVKWPYFILFIPCIVLAITHTHQHMQTTELCVCYK